MELLQIICPSCGGELNISNPSEFIFCNFCGNKFAFQQRCGNKPEVANYMLLANDSLEIGMAADAINYYNKVLEYEPNNYKALIGKGYAIFLTSTLANLKFRQMEALFKHAFSLAPEDEKENAVIEIKTRTLMACEAFYRLSIPHGKSYFAVTFLLPFIDDCATFYNDFRVLNDKLFKFAIDIIENEKIYFNVDILINEYKKRIKSEEKWLKEKEQKIYWKEHPEEYQLHIENLYGKLNKLKETSMQYENKIERVSEKLCKWVILKDLKTKGKTHE